MLAVKHHGRKLEAPPGLEPGSLPYKSSASPSTLWSLETFLNISYASAS
jgi:hypothetical protein